MLPTLVSPVIQPDVRSLTGTLALCKEGSKIVEICQKGDELLDEEIAKVYKGKKITKGVFILLAVQTVPADISQPRGAWRVGY